MKRLVTLLTTIFCIAVLHAEVSKTLTMNEAGTLSTILTAGEKTSITELILSGPIDSRDFECMCDEMTVLANLDLEDAEIVAYSGFSWEPVYEAHEIPKDAFYDNKVLTSIVLPSGLESIGYSAFRACESLTELTILPAGLKSIGEYAFYQSKMLSGSLVFPEGLKSIGHDAFNYCEKLTGDLILPQSLTVLGYGAFSRCKGFDGVLVLSDSITSIGQNTFNGCSGLKGDLDLPSRLKSIGNYAFGSCSGLTGELEFSSELELIGDNAFYQCSGLIGELKFVSALESVGRYAFYNCTGLNGVVDFSAGLVALGDNAFWGCAGLTGVIFGDDLKEIGGYVFYGCEGISGTLSFPEGLESIGRMAFYGITGVDCVKMNNAVPVTLLDNTFSEEVIFVPAEAKAAYESANYWKNYTIIEEEVSLTLDVETPGTLVTMISDAGLNVNLVTHLTLTGTINDADFKILREKMPLLFSLNLEGLENTSLPDGAFSENTTLTYVVLPSVLDTLGADVFNECISLSMPLVFPNGLMTIGASAFAGCKGMFGEVEFPLSLVSVEGSAFSQCENLRGDLNLPEGLLSLGGFAFYNCKGFSSVYIPESLQSIAYYAFYSMDNVQLVRCMSQAPPEVGSSCFNGIDMDVCRLEVPKGSLDTFSIAAEWEDFMNVYEIETPPESSYIKIQVTSGGIASKDGLVLTNGRVLAVEKEGSLTVDLVPKEGYLLKSVVFNETDYTHKVSDASFTTPSNNESGILSVVFERERVVVTILTTGSGVYVKDNVIAGSNREYDILAEVGLIIESVSLNGLDVTNDLVEGRIILSNILEDQTIVINPVDDISTKSVSLVASCNINAWTASGQLFVESDQIMVGLEVISLNGIVITQLNHASYSYVLEAPLSQVFIIRARLEDGRYENIKIAN